MKALIINPNIVTQKGDFFGTGIPYMPIIPAYIAAYLRGKECDVKVIDAFGEDPSIKRVENEKFIVQGLSYDKIIGRINGSETLICIYAGHLVEHFVVINIIDKIRNKHPRIKIAIIENSQAVTAYSLVNAKKEFFDAKADFIIYGEPEEAVFNILKKLSSKKHSAKPSEQSNMNKSPDTRKFSEINNIIYEEKGEIKINPISHRPADLDSLPFPAWDLFPIKNYWKLGYAHATYQTSYLPLLSSRGCPFNCAFCVIPSTNLRKWNKRSAKNVFDEISHFVKKYRIKEFHFEDLNAIIDKERIQELCRYIIDAHLNIKLKFVSGIKIECLDEKTIVLLKQAGCDYISFSPESGSNNVLRLMNKPFNHEYAIEMLKVMERMDITTQACFILGFPGEKKADITRTEKYLYRLFRTGLDETAILVMTPVPGSRTYEQARGLHKNLSALTFSPVWRKDYDYYNKKRLKMYVISQLIKISYHPVKFFNNIFHALIGKFKNKIEMTIYRVIKVYFFTKSQ